MSTKSFDLFHPQRRLRIAHVCFSRHRREVEEHVRDLALAQAQMGHEVHLVGSWRSALKHAVPAGVTYHRLATALYRPSRLNALLQDLEVDVCHAHLGPACKAVSGCEHVVRVATLHDGFLNSDHQLLDGVVCIEPSQPAQIARFPGRTSVVSRWPVAAQPRAALQLRAQLELTNDQILVGVWCAENGNPGEPSFDGVDVVLRAFSQYAPQNAVMVLLGDSRDCRAHRQWCRFDERIRMLPRGMEPEEAFQNLDVFVAAANGEAQAQQILNAMQYGLPMVACRSASADELLTRTDAMLVAADDVKAIGHALRLWARSLSDVTDRQLPSHRVHYDLAPYHRRSSALQIESHYRALMGWVEGPSYFGGAVAMRGTETLAT